VTLLNTDRKDVVRTVQTSEAGFYTATLLLLGGYTVTVSASSFGGQVFNGIVLHVGDALTINGTLKTGTVEKVTVTAEAQSLNFENATQASLINGTQVRELVLSSPNYEQLHKRGCRS
jgi:Carboxypeptidase regulatory-like domain